MATNKKIYVNFGAGNPVAIWQNLDSSPHFLLPSRIHQFLYKRGLSQRSEYFLEHNYSYYKFSKTSSLPYADDTVSAVYASHVLEHLSIEENQHFFEECSRVLEKGGIIRVLVPDLEAKLLLDDHIFSMEYQLLTLPKELKENKLRAMLEAFHGFPSFHKSLFVRKNLKKFFAKKWKVSLKKGYLDSSISTSVLRVVEQKSRTKDALVFELTKK